MIRLRKGQRVGPWVLESRLLNHNGCEIWNVRHSKLNTSAIVKLKEYIEMTGELKFIIDYNYNYSGYRLPIFDIETTYRCELSGTLREYGWIAMKKYNGDLEDLGHQLVCKYWKSIMRQCLSQIYKTHIIGYIHSDLKGMNILVSADDETCDVAICDFGLAEESDKSIRMGRPAGCLPYYYMCSGKYPDEPMGARADYEALGIAVGLRLMNTAYQVAFKKSEEAECRKWRNLKEHIPDYLHGYFEILNEVEWHQRRITDETYSRLLKFFE